MPFDQLVNQITANDLATSLVSLLIGAYIALRHLTSRRAVPVAAVIR